MSVKKVTELFNDDNNGHCIFDAINKCKMGDKCSRKHLDSSKAMYILKKNIKDPTYLLNKDDIAKQIKEQLGIKQKLYFTTCTFNLQDRKCKNEMCRRKNKVNAIFKGKKMEIEYCYGDISKNTNRVFCGLHIDICYSIQGYRLNINDIISYSAYDTRGERMKLAYEKEKARIAEEKAKKIKESLSSNNFPEFVDNSNSIKEDTYWCEKETRVEEKEEQHPNNKNELKFLDLDKSPNNFNIVSMYRTCDYPDEDYIDYDMFDTFEYSNNEKHELMQALISCA